MMCVTCGCYTRAKGGKERAFNIPLSSECVRILERRRSDNRVVFAQGDGGWVFPTRALKEKACALCTALGQKPHSAGAVVHLIEGKEQRTDKKSGGETDPAFTSSLRDTYALVEVGGISPFVIDVLTNHRSPRGSATAGYVDLSIEHLAQCQERMTQFLLAKLQPPPSEKVKKPSKKRSADRHLRSLP